LLLLWRGKLTIKLILFKALVTINQINHLFQFQYSKTVWRCHLTQQNGANLKWPAVSALLFAFPLSQTSRHC